MLIEFLKYVAWAAIQHATVLTPIFFITSNELYRSILAIFLFSVIGHIPNWLLVGLTFCLSVVFYPLFFYLDFKIFIGVLLVLIHAAAGTFLKINGYEMRVWGFK